MADDPTFTPTDRPPASEDSDALLEAKRRAAIALLTSIEARANSPEAKSIPGLLDNLAKSFRNVSESFPRSSEATIGEVGTTPQDPTSPRLSALNWFFHCVRHDVGLPAEEDERRTTNQEAAYVLELLRKNYNTVNAELLGAKLELDAVTARCASFEEENRAFVHAAAGHTALAVLRGTLPHRIRLALDQLLAMQKTSRTQHVALENIDAWLAKAFHNATKQASVSVLDTDTATARNALPSDATAAQCDEHAQRYAIIRELSSMALAERHLRNELQVANDECTSLREQLSAIRSLLAKDGFHCEKLADGVEVALESLVDARKERDAADAELDAIRKAIKADSPSVLASVQVLLEEITARVQSTTKLRAERDDNREQLQAARSKIIGMVDCLDGRARIDVDLSDPDVKKAFDFRAVHMTNLALLGEVDALLQDARKWTTYDFEVNNHGRRMDVIRSLAARAEALHMVQAALAKTDLDPELHPSLAVRRLIDKYLTLNAVYAELQAHGQNGDPVMAVRQLTTDLKAVQDENTAMVDALGLTGKTADPRGDAAKVATERDALRATILAVQDALGAMPLDPTRPPNTGSKTDTIKAVADVVAERDRLTSKVLSVQAALQIANTQLQVANGNLVAALRLSIEGSPRVDLVTMVRSLTWLIDHWNRGAEPYRRAALALDRALRDSLGDSFSMLLAASQESRGTNEIGAIVGVAMEGAAKGDFVALDVTDALLSAGPFSVSEGFETSRAKLDEAVQRNVDKGVPRDPAIPVRTSLGALGVPPMEKLTADGPVPVQLGDKTIGAATNVEVRLAGERRGIPLINPATFDKMPVLFDCGCSRWKVAAGRCDVYDANGKPRESDEVSEEFKAEVRAEIDEAKGGGES